MLEWLLMPDYLLSTWYDLSSMLRTWRGLPKPRRLSKTWTAIVKILKIEHNGKKYPANLKFNLVYS